MTKDPVCGMAARADLKILIVAVSLLYAKGYFDQRLDEWGNRQESPVARQSIAFNASFFNTHRMVQQYAAHAYV